MIAISYRREDSTAVAGRLYDKLQAEFGKANVFMDFDSIPYGADFREHIRETLEKTKVVLAVIGPAWLGNRAGATRRIDEAADFVRFEIAHALKCGTPIIPVLVNNTPMPDAASLPPDLERLALRNALRLDTGVDFHHHADRLVATIRRLLDASTPAQKIAVAETPARRNRIVFLSAAVCLAALTALGAWYAASHPTHALPPALSAGPSPAREPSLDTPAARPPVEPLPAATKDESARVSTVIRSHYDALSRHDEAGALANFAARGFFLGTVRDKSSVAADFSEYLRTWDRIKYDLGSIYVSQTSDGGLFADFDLSYTLSNRSGEKTGRSRNLWVLVNGPNGLEVGYVKETAK